MKKFRILIAGCGDVGSAVGIQLARDHIVYGLRRSIQHIPKPITAIKADFSDLSTLTNLPDVDIVIYCAAPNRDKADSYTSTYLNGFKNIMANLPKKVSHVFFTSSTSVYSQCDHEWVNEQSPVLAQSANAKIMLQSEQQVQNTYCNSTIIRFSGIYSAKRLHLFNQVVDGSVYAASPVQYSNRIHVDDCAGVVSHLINKLAINQRIAPLYLASDMSPAPISDVMTWLAKNIDQQATPIQSPRKNNGKRCDNQLLMNTGYQFIYPDYKSGYRQVIEQFKQQN